ncbi:single-stranded DNA-binding protein [Glycomyces sp. MUSA5-2]|uniref:single-stranded DNA-binding protein n=1 Tax=Glycomyces sp. MUSA5-2 TaxID=2053002 RepID=UPI003009A418
MTAGTSEVTVAGNLTADPELKYAASGKAWARFTVAQTPRRYDQAAGRWMDGDTLFMRCTAFGQIAENTANSLSKGQRVIVAGKLRQSEWETAEGQKRSAIELVADEVGASLQWTTVQLSKTSRGSGAAPAEDPWSQQAPRESVGAAAGGGFDVEPPF